MSASPTTRTLGIPDPLTLLDTHNSTSKDNYLEFYRSKRFCAIT
jgi:hypothetical protein